MVDDGFREDVTVIHHATGYIVHYSIFTPQVSKMWLRHRFLSIASECMAGRSRKFGSCLCLVARDAEGEN